jgi:hypothetical protein
MRLLTLIGLMVMGMMMSQEKVAPQPVIVELFTSEGCSSCPPADKLLAELVQKQPIDSAQIIPLAFHVDYWNKLGWTDRFSTPEFTQRQREYGQAMKLQSMYTPQMVVDGREEFVGSDGDAARKAVEQASHDHKAAVRLTAEGNRIHVQVSNLPSKQECDVLVAITEDDLQSDVRRGENRGRKLSHVAVVRRLIRVGQARGVDWSGDAEFAIDREWKPEKLRVVAFVQEADQGPILGAASSPLQK